MEPGLCSFSFLPFPRLLAVQPTQPSADELSPRSTELLQAHLGPDPASADLKGLPDVSQIRSLRNRSLPLILATPPLASHLGAGTSPGHRQQGQRAQGRGHQQHMALTMLPPGSSPSSTTGPLHAGLLSDTPTGFMGLLFPAPIISPTLQSAASQGHGRGRLSARNTNTKK